MSLIAQEHHSHNHPHGKGVHLEKVHWRLKKAHEKERPPEHTHCKTARERVCVCCKGFQKDGKSAAFKGPVLLAAKVN